MELRLRRELAARIRLDDSSDSVPDIRLRPPQSFRESAAVALPAKEPEAPGFTHECRVAVWTVRAINFELRGELFRRWL